MALRLALIYAAAGALWILLSDSIVGGLGYPQRLERAVESGKGILFVLVTASVLYHLAWSGMSRVHDAQLQLHDQERKIRQAYVDVLDAVTGGRLVVVSSEELKQELGEPVMAPESFESASRLAAVRSRIKAAIEQAVSDEGAAKVLNATGEALTNALKHAGSGSYQVLMCDGVVQVAVNDQGPGIDFRTLPKAALVPGFSTAQTLGMGFTIMLQLAERVLICTEPGATTIVLEFAEPTSES